LFQATTKGGRYTEQSYVSTSEEDNDQEDDDAASSGDEDPMITTISRHHDDEEKKAEDQEVIHDLNNVVRSRKHQLESPLGRAAMMMTTVSPAPRRCRRQHGAERRLICTLSAHTGSSVLCVRFAPSGRYLASAGDDTCVCIYAPAATISTTDNGNNNDEEVTWMRIHLCRGHGLDVVGLTWAPDDSYLVSCSLDSETPIIVWKVALQSTNNGTSPNRKLKSMILNPHRILGANEHTSTVKGVAFDPAGSYLASSGDDPAVCLWRTYDDWGLERRIDAASGIFRTATESMGTSIGGSAQSLFRRLSWSTDGSFVCSTNSVVKNRHVCSTISREGWNVSSSSDGTSSGRAANLIGHKFPVVATRAATKLLDGRTDSTSSHEQFDNDREPAHGMLLALGDQSGYVSLWSTRHARAIFKLQCSESRCMVTDLAWGTTSNGDLVLYVSLLDGHVTALCFNVPDEIGPVLSDQQHARVFQLRYGIDLDEEGFASRRGFLLGNANEAAFVENPLQMSLENQFEDEATEELERNQAAVPKAPSRPSSEMPQASQHETRGADGKKRIRPVLLNVEPVADKRSKPSEKDSAEQAAKRSKDPMEWAMDAARKVSALSESSSLGQTDVGDITTQSPPQTSTDVVPPVASVGHAHVGATVPGPWIPHTPRRAFSVDLPVLSPTISEFGESATVNYIAQTVNSVVVPQGSRGRPTPSVEVAISGGADVSWRDTLPGAVCSAVAAVQSVLAVGTTDGVIQLYGTSPATGWASGVAYRSHPPLVLGHAVVALQLKQHRSDGQRQGHEITVTMLAVTGDGNFGVYTILPDLVLRYKGSVVPALSHMSLSSTSGMLPSGNMPGRPAPQVSRVILTDTEKVLLLLSLKRGDEGGRLPGQEAATQRLSDAKLPIGVGGALQAYVYHQPSDLWFRISDSRFILSEFYSAMPPTRNGIERAGELSRIDDFLRLGSVESGLQYFGSEPLDRSLLGSSILEGTPLDDLPRNAVATRSHCEDRLAVSIAFASAADFEFWFSRYARILARLGGAGLVRQLVDMILPSNAGSVDPEHPCGWLSSAPDVLGLDRQKLVKTVLIPELSKNRSLQRLTNEIMMETNLLAS
jgi:protein HIRA/HIR1